MQKSIKRLRNLFQVITATITKILSKRNKEVTN